jgi:HEAT repeat protein
MLDEDEIDFEKLEFIIQFMLDSLKDPDTEVRWTAAKGIGRITQRLTKDFADQIVEQLSDLF